MRKVLALTFALGMAGAAIAAEHLPRGTATDISNAEIQRIISKTPNLPVSDQQIRVLNINGEYNVGVGVVHRAKTAKQSVGGSEHSQITEIYHVISGNGTLLTGGSIDNPKERAPDVRIDPHKVLPAGYVNK